MRWKTVFEVVEAAGRRRFWEILGVSRHLGQEMLVETLLSDWPGLGVVFTQPELEVSLVEGGQLHLDVEDLALGQVGCHHPQAVFAAQLVRSGLGKVEGVSTHPTLPLVPVPLSPKPATVALVVVDVCRSVEAVPPHGRPAGRLPQSAVSGCSGEEQQDKERHPQGVLTLTGAS